MYKEVAVDPSCMGDMNYYYLLKNEFGFDMRRYVISEPKLWVKEAIAAVKNASIGDVKKKSIKNLLNKIYKNRIKIITLPAYRNSSPQSPWIDWWQYQMSNCCFAVSLSESGIDSSCTYASLMESNESFKVPVSERVDKTKQAILSVVQPLLQISTEAYLVDQFFVVPNNQVFAGLVRLCNEIPGLNKLTIVTAVTSKDVGSYIFEICDVMNITSLSIKVIFAPEKFFHERYLITDLGAIRSGQGFSAGIEKGQHADKLNMNPIGQDEAKSVLVALHELEIKGDVEVGFDHDFRLVID